MLIMKANTLELFEFLKEKTPFTDRCEWVVSGESLCLNDKTGYVIASITPMEEDEDLYDMTVFHQHEEEQSEYRLFQLEIEYVMVTLTYNVKDVYPTKENIIEVWEDYIVGVDFK